MKIFKNFKFFKKKEESCEVEYLDRVPKKRRRNALRLLKEYRDGLFITVSKKENRKKKKHKNKGNKNGKIL